MQFLLEDIIRNNSVKLFCIWTSGSDVVLSRVLATPLLAKRNHLCNFGRGHHEEQCCEIILNLNQWFRRCRLKDNSYLVF